MTRFLGEPPGPTRDLLEPVVCRAMERGAQVPSFLAVEDAEGVWLRAVAAEPPAERARSVLVAAGEGGLERAIRLGVGGALWLPPSTVAATEALAAAADAPLPTVVDPALVELAVDRGDAVRAVTFADLPGWRAELGLPLLVDLLARLARGLDVSPALLAWPALVVGGRSPAEVAAAWEGVGREVEWARVLELELVEQGEGRGLTGLCTALTRAETVGVRPGRTGPVVELSSGRSVVPDPAVLRVPPWASRRPRPGSPAGLLLERLASCCERRGVPLWVPLVDREMLRFLVRLPGRVWVDGPVVP